MADFQLLADTIAAAALLSCWCHADLFCAVVCYTFLQVVRCYGAKHDI
jgi:hypothetical protein